MSRLPFPFRVPVRGVSYRPAAVAAAVAGEPVDIEHEPLNPSDQNALKVMRRDGSVLGYLPAALAARLVADHGTGVRLTAHIEGVTGRDIRGVRLCVTGLAAPARPALEAAPTMLVTRTVQTRTVRTRSGRVVGTLVDRNDDVVRVTVDGRTVPYPASLVTVDDPTATADVTDASPTPTGSSMVAAGTQPADRLDETVQLPGSADRKSEWN